MCSLWCVYLDQSLFEFTVHSFACSGIIVSRTGRLFRLIINTRDMQLLEFRIDFSNNKYFRPIKNLYELSLIAEPMFINLYTVSTTMTHNSCNNASCCVDIFFECFRAGHTNTSGESPILQWQKDLKEHYKQRHI